MRLREFGLLVAICLVWGFHFIVIRLTVTEVPPLFYVAVRMSVLAVIMIPFLRFPKGQILRLIGAGLGLGALNYAFLFTGLKYATASAGAVAIELSPPFATLLSVIFLKEQVGWRRTLGIALAFAGVAFIALRPSEAQLGLGVGLIALGALSEASGTVLAKSVKGVKPINMLALFSIVGTCVLWPLTFIFETGQREALRPDLLPQLCAAIAYSVLLASVFGHTSYYWLLQRLPVSQVAPSLLLTTVFAVTFGVVLLHEPFTPTMIVGAMMTLTGVGIILMRTKRSSPAAAVEPGGP